MSREDDWPGCYPEGRNNNKKHPKFPPSSILAGYEDAIWRALAHVNPKEFDREKYSNGNDKGKQIPVREALEKIGLGWVATNSQSLRPVIGKL